MSWVLARTERVLVGTSVMTPTFRYNPAVVAQTFATMACLAPGRVMLGVGTGEALNEVVVGAVGDEDPWPQFKERFARLREAVRLMRELWTQDRVTFEGDYYRTPTPPSTTVRAARAGLHRRGGLRWSHGTPGGSATASSARPARGVELYPDSLCRRSTRVSTRPVAPARSSTG